MACARYFGGPGKHVRLLPLPKPVILIKFTLLHAALAGEPGASKRNGRPVLATPGAGTAQQHGRIVWVTRFTCPNNARPRDDPRAACCGTHLPDGPALGVLLSHQDIMHMVLLTAQHCVQQESYRLAAVSSAHSLSFQVTPKHLLHGNNYSVSAVCFSQDGQFIATASK